MWATVNSYLLRNSFRARGVIDNGGEAIGVETEQRRGLCARCRPVADAGRDAADNLAQRGSVLEKTWSTHKKTRTLINPVPTLVADVIEWG